MLQTIERFLTFYGKIDAEDRNTILQAAVNPHQTELQMLEHGCFNLVYDQIQMETRMKLRLPKPDDSIIIDTILRSTVDKCQVLINKHPDLIPHRLVPVFMAAMMHFTYRGLQSARGTRTYPALQSYCVGMQLPEIHISKRPRRASDVIELLETETYESISKEK
jgi:hypothetical protein